MKRVIVAGDNDASGEAGIAKAAPIYLSKGYEVVTVALPAAIKDLNQLLVEQGADAMRRVLDEAGRWEPRGDGATSADGDEFASSDGGDKERLIERADDVVVRPSAYLIKGLLGRGAMGLIYGASTVGKTFVALRLASHIATGTPFGNHRALKAPVLYASLEGHVEFGKRIVALRRVAGPHDNFLWRLCAQPVLGRGEHGDRGEQQILAAAQQLAGKAKEPAGLIVIDTLWRAMGGDEENDASAMSHLLTRIARIQAATGAAVLLVHHAGKDPEKGPRGTSALMPAMDFMARLDGKGDQRHLKMEKNKDGPDGQVFRYRLEVVEIGQDNEDDMVTSCVAQFDFNGQQRSKDSRKRPLSTTQAGKALEQLRELLIRGAHVTAKGKEGIPDGVDLVELDAWRVACERKRLTVETARAASESKAFRRACEQLEKTGWVARTDDWVWLIDK